MALPFLPPSLADLLGAVQADNVSCIGDAYPCSSKCERKLTASDEHFVAAKEQLQQLLTNGIDDHGPGLIDALKTVAWGFSCSKIHRIKSHTELFPYYWISRHILHDVLDFPGLVRVLTDVPVAQIGKAEAVIGNLNPIQIWIAHNTLKRLSKTWWKPETDGYNDKIREMIKAKFKRDGKVKNNRSQRQDAHQQWNSWRLAKVRREDGSSVLPLAVGNDDGNCDDPDESISETDRQSEDLPNAKSGQNCRSCHSSPVRQPITPTLFRGNSSPGSIASASTPFIPNRPSLLHTPVSAPQPPSQAYTGPQQIGSSSVPQLRRSRLSSSGIASSPTAAANVVDQASQSSGTPDRDYEDGESSTVCGSKRKRSLQRSESPGGYGDRSGSGHEEYSMLSHSPNTPPPSIVVPQSSQSRRRRTRAESILSHSFEINSSEISDQEATSNAVITPKYLKHLESMGCKNARFPHFKHLDDEPKDVRQTVFKVFEEMRKDLKARSKCEDDAGCIYALSIPGHDGFIKIGRTERKIEQRIAEHMRHNGIKLDLLNPNDYCKVANHERVEQLIHLELQKYRRYFECTCKAKSNLHCDGADGLVRHGEWFEIDKKKAMTVVRRWRNWMSRDPYCNRKLRQAEQLRINQYAKVRNLPANEEDEREKEERGYSNGMRTASASAEEDPTPLNKLIDEDRYGNQIWRWDIFMRFSRWQLAYLQARVFFFEERSKRVDISSRWDSFCTHWQSNVLFCLMFFMLSIFMTFVADLFPSLFALAPVFALANSVVFGSIAVLYAA